MIFRGFVGTFWYFSCGTNIGCEIIYYKSFIVDLEEEIWYYKTDLAIDISVCFRNSYSLIC